jgi:cupin superfamily acireductone dioxygenase involved in methionine salvage
VLIFTKIIFTLAMFTSFTSNAENMDILKIYNQFTLASAAASKCIKPSKEELNAFLVNYQMVVILMHKEIKKRKPEYSEKDLEKVMTNRNTKATDAVNKVIKSEGCSSNKIQDLIKRFYMQLKWKPL